MPFYSAVRTALPGLMTVGSTVLCTGCGGNSTSGPTPLPTPLVLTPACGNPALIKGNYDPRLSTYIVFLAPGTIAPEQAPFLATKYGFTVEYALTSSPAFTAELSPEVLAQLRCDPLVTEIFYPSVVLPAS